MPDSPTSLCKLCHHHACHGSSRLPGAPCLLRADVLAASAVPQQRRSCAAGDLSSNAGARRRTQRASRRRSGDAPGDRRLSRPHGCGSWPWWLEPTCSAGQLVSYGAAASTVRADPGRRFGLEGRTLIGSWGSLHRRTLGPQPLTRWRRELSSIQASCWAPAWDLDLQAAKRVLRQCWSASQSMCQAAMYCTLRVRWTRQQGPSAGWREPQHRAGRKVGDFVATPAR